MGKGTFTAVLDDSSVGTLDIIWGSQTVFIRIHGTEAEQTVKFLSLHSLMAGKIFAVFIIKILMAMFHNKTLYTLLRLPHQ